MAEQKGQAKQWAKIVAKAWSDDEYRQRLIEDPVSVLTEEGFEVPEGLEIKVVEATEKQLWMILPPKPEKGSMEEGEERQAATLSYMSCAPPQIV